MCVQVQGKPEVDTALWYQTHNLRVCFKLAEYGDGRGVYTSLTDHTHGALIKVAMVTKMGVLTPC
jgi:Mor family transcriptional regulator